MSIFRYLSVLKEPPILIIRFLDTVMTKFGCPFYKVPAVHYNKKTVLKQCPTGNIGDYEINETEKSIADLFLNHRFAVLGDKWVLYSEEQSDGKYKDIKWQLDYKSGFSFDSNMLSGDCLKNIPKGVDIKTPWEISRLQHLPFLARMSAGGHLTYSRVKDEFVNEVCGFIDGNRMGYGVNWACSMDVAIRAVNILLAYDMLWKNVRFDGAFIEKLTRSMYEHGAYIYRNLEKNFTEDKSGNHYLSDLCGLIAISVHLECKDAKKWFEFASKELISEIDKQIFTDGGNYEFSTAYQRLDCEILALSLAYLAHKKVSISQKIADKMLAAYDFLNSAAYSDGQIIQIGDNDSGHLFRLSYKGNIVDGLPKIDELDGTAAAEVVKALYSEAASSPESSMIRGIMEDTVFKGNTADAEYPKELGDGGEYKYKSETSIDLPTDGEVKTKIFGEFGLCIIQKGSFKLFFRLPVSIKKGKPLHIHSDFLHYEFESNGEKHYRDRGSFSYSGNETERNEFRSAPFHNVPVYEEEQNAFSGVWGIVPKASGAFCAEDGCVKALLKIGDAVHRRSIFIKENELIIVDESNHPFAQGYIKSDVFSAGYGIKCIKE